MNQSSLWTWPLRSDAARIWRLRIFGLETLLQIVGTLTLLVHLGVRRPTTVLETEVAIVISSVLFLLAGALVGRRVISTEPARFVRDHAPWLVLCFLWPVGVVAIGMAGSWGSWPGWVPNRALAILGWSETIMLAWAVLGMFRVIRRLSLLGASAAVVFAGSFVAVIAAGSALLMLPSARTEAALQISYPHPALAAVFTSTSACCVTGLVVVDTASYWSRTGQVIILVLIQVGGLGIMTFGGFLSLFTQRAMQSREGALFGELFEAEQAASVQRLLIEIVVFTLSAELLGTLLLWASGMWPDLPLGERLFWCLFHAVSAFCNAGFALTPENASFVGQGHLWGVWGVVAGLVIIGGFGFESLHEVGAAAVARVRSLSRFRPQLVRGVVHRRRMGLSARLALVTTVCLLVGGTAAIFLLERMDGGTLARQGAGRSLLDAWFQSVILRTAGFNSIDLGLLQPATKLVSIILMFIGASPMSTGGGVKTVAFAAAILALRSILRNREHVEAWGRTILDMHVKRALTIVAVGMVVVTTSTFAMLVFEQSFKNADVLNRHEPFLDVLFEATSAFATVGTSTGITHVLSVPSQVVLILTMFVGRIGPLTLLVAVAGSGSGARYHYPIERISLG